MKVVMNLMCMFISAACLYANAYSYHNIVKASFKSSHFHKGLKTSQTTCGH